MSRGRFPHRYRLLDADGGDLGLLAASEPRWRTGDTLHRGAGRLEVLRVVDAEPGEAIRAYLIVADASPPAAAASVVPAVA